MTVAGITGTQSGATKDQMTTLVYLYREWGVEEVHHGDCVGADEQSDEAAAFRGIYRVAHPGPDGPKRAYCDSDEVRPQRPYLTRNEDIVLETDVLFALPRTAEEQRRSGTWATVRLARRLGRPVVIVEPDGTVREERT